MSQQSLHHDHDPFGIEIVGGQVGDHLKTQTGQSGGSKDNNNEQKGMMDGCH